MKKCLFFFFFVANLCAQVPVSVHGTAVKLSATATDVTSDPNDLECGVAYVQFFANSIAISPPVMIDTTTQTYDFVWNSTTISNGPYSLQARAPDKAGPNCDGTIPNTGIAEISIVVDNQDKTPPTVTITTPINGASLSQHFVPIQAASTGAVHMELFLNQKLSYAANAAFINYSWNTSPFKGENVSILAIATGKNQITGSQEIAVSVQK